MKCHASLDFDTGAHEACQGDIARSCGEVGVELIKFRAAFAALAHPVVVSVQCYCLAARVRLVSRARRQVTRAVGQDKSEGPIGIYI